MAILFFTKGVTFRLAHPRKTSSWIKDVVHSEKHSLQSLNYVFCNDAFLSKLNSHYLKHNALTDIITFDYSAGSGPIAGEIYISIQRVRENARKFHEPLDKELHRVIIHGVLHLLGYGDKTGHEKAAMREKEEAYLSLR